MEVLGGIQFFCRSILPAEDSRRPRSSGYGLLSCIRAQEGQLICLRRQWRHRSCHSVLSCSDSLWSFGNGQEGSRRNAAGCVPSGSDGISILSSRESNGLAREKEEDEKEEDRVMEIDGNMQNNGDSAELPMEIDGNDSLQSLNDSLLQAKEDLDTARVNSARLEEIAREVAEKAIVLRDKASIAEKEADMAVELLRAISEEESKAEEALQKMESILLSYQNDTHLSASQPTPLEREEKEKEGEEESQFLESESAQSAVENEAQPTILSTNTSAKTLEEEKVDFNHEKDFNAAHLALSRCQEELRRIRDRKPELEAEAFLAKEASEKAKTMMVLANEDAANAMLLAEQAVAMEMEAAQRLSDTEIALQKAINTPPPIATNATELKVSIEEDDLQEKFKGEDKHLEQGEIINSDNTISPLILPSKEAEEIGEDLEKRMKALLVERSTWVEEKEGEKSKAVVANSLKRADVVKESSPPPPPMLPPGHPKSMTKKSSRFFSASYFFFEDDGAEFTPGTVFQGFVLAVKKQFPKVVLGLLVLTAGGIFLNNRMEKQANLRQGPEIMSIEDVTASTKPLVREIQRISKKTMALLEKIPHQEVNEEEASLFDILWLLLASVIFVPIFQKLPGGSPVLGYLAAGVLIGPYGLSFIRHVHVTKAIAEFGVVFLLFNIGLELSVERLSSMKKYVFGLGSAQVLTAALAIGLFAHYICGISGPGSLVLGNGLALSSTAVVLQVLQERGESTSRHGRAAFSVLLFQDLAVVVLLILIPLLSPNSSKGGVGFQVILEALGVSAVKAIIAIAGIIAGGRLLLRPIYNRMAENQNAEIFAANTLFVVLGTSVLTARAGLSMALGAFLAGLLLAETEFALQVESDIAPYRGLLLGLFFMTVGMSIDPKLFVARFPTILGTLCLLIAGKTFLVASVGQVFGLSAIAAIRAGLLLAPGGEFAFVAFGEAVNQGIMTSQMCSLLFLVVGLSMALTPWLGAGGQFIAARFEQQDVRSLLPAENETDDLQDHIIICGYGRVGQIIAQLLSERLIPFVALDVRSERVSSGRALDLPVFFGDVGSKEVLHKVGAERASCAVIALDTPGANYRAVWTLSKYFPKVKTFVRAHDVDHGINLEKAGATAVVPETLEPSLQLAAAVLAQAKLPASEIAASIEDFRSRHLSELTELCEASGSCLGYGFSGKSKQLLSESISKGKLNEDSEWRQEALASP